MHRRNCVLICYQDNASIGWAVRGIMRIRVFSINGNKVGNKPLTQEEEGETVTIDQRTEFDFVSSFVLVLLGIGADRGGYKCKQQHATNPENIRLWSGF